MDPALKHILTRYNKEGMISYLNTHPDVFKETAIAHTKAH